MLALLYTFTLLVPFDNDPMKFAASTLPVKLAVLPASSKLTVKFGTITFPLKLAVLPPSSRLTVKLFVVVLLDTLTKLAVAKLPRSAFNEVIFPVKLAVLPSNWAVKFALLAVTKLPKLALPVVKLPVTFDVSLVMLYVTMMLPALAILPWTTRSVVMLA